MAKKKWNSDFRDPVTDGEEGYIIDENAKEQIERIQRKNDRRDKLFKDRQKRRRTF